MNNISDFNLNISMLHEHFSDFQDVAIGDAFTLFDIRPSKTMPSMPDPCRIDGMVMLYCIKGRIRISINMNEYDMLENSLLICTSGNIVKLIEVLDDDIYNHRYILLALSREYTSELRVDFKNILNEILTIKNAPVIHLADSQKDIIMDYINLIKKVSGQQIGFKDSVLRGVISSMMSMAAGLWINGISQLKSEQAVSSNRSRIIFEQFIKLVSENYMNFRNVGFYADKLCLTPKYLSKLIKTYSGRSAPEWIDAYVILEAKNLLKYSDLTIKEIVYRMNFPNQSVFYKFFKARTGMTPSIYRNS